MSARVQQIYIALFGRPADPLGEQFWDNLTNNGANLAPMLAALTPLPEYQGRFAGLSTAQQVNSIYQSLFGRDADLTGLTFFVNQINSGALTLATLAVNILDGAQGTDKEIIENKVTSAQNFTASLNTTAEILAYTGDTGIQAGTSFLSGISSDDSSVKTTAQADAAVTALVNNTGSGAVGTTFTLTDSTDVINGTAQNDTIIAGLKGGAATLTAGDVINGLGGTDRLDIFGDSNASAFASAQVSNVEQVYVQFDTNATAASIDVSGNSGVTQAWVSKGNIDGGATVTLTKAQTAGITGAVTSDNTPAAADTLTFTFKDAGASTADAATLALNGASLEAGDILEVDAIETLTVSAEGTNNVRNLSADSVSKLVVTGSGKFSATAADTDTGTGGYQGGTYKTIDASANAGGVTIDISAVTAQDVTITGGAGADEITLLAAGLTKADTIDLGAGVDTLAFSDNATFSTAVQAEALSKVSNVEVLKVVGNTLTVDADVVSQSIFVADENGADVAISDAVNNTTVRFLDGTFDASSVNMKLGANTLNVELKGDSADASNLTAGAGLTVTGSATVNLSSSGEAGVGANALDLVAADNQAVNITGAKDLTLVATAATGTTGFAIDGSAFTGKLDVTGTAAADIIKGGSAADTIRAFGSGVDTLTGNGGGDTFVVFTAAAGDLDTGYTAGPPVVIDLTAVSVTDVITDFTTGSDKLGGFGTAASATNYVEASAAAATLDAFKSAADTALNGTVKYYVGQVGADTYVAFDDDGNGFTALVQLQGVALDGIAQADIIA